MASGVPAAGAGRRGIEASRIGEEGRPVPRLERGGAGRAGPDRPAEEMRGADPMPDAGRCASLSASGRGPDLLGMAGGWRSGPVALPWRRERAGIGSTG
jgi:hypothetical protein